MPCGSSWGEVFFAYSVRLFVNYQIKSEELYMSCCSTNCCDWFNQHFGFNVSESDQGVTVEVTVKDPNKVNALKDLVNSAKRFCQAFCSKP